MVAKPPGADHPAWLITLDNFIITAFGLTDDFLHTYLNEGRLRERDPRQTVPDSVVLTCELVGEFLCHDTDRRTDGVPLSAYPGSD